jgi:hypothetical protein
MYQTALVQREEDQAILGSIDITPTFSVGPQAGVAAAFERLPASWPAHGISRSRSPEFTATSVASRTQLAFYLCRLFASLDQTMVTSPWQMWVVPVSTQPAQLIGDFHQWTPAVVLDSPSPADAALTAVADLQRWLAIGQDQVATLARFAPRSVKNWREGMDPYAATVRRLFDLHALVGSLNRTLGVEGARLWLADAGPAGVSRRDRLVDDVGLRGVISEASAILFERPTVPPVHALDFDEEPNAEVSPRSELFSGPVRRARRRP